MISKEDRNLLDLAAAALGLTEFGGPDDCRPAGLVLLRGVPTHYEGHGEFGYAWNPLNDPASAFALMADVPLSVQYAPYNKINVRCGTRLLWTAAYLHEHHREAVTRRALVHATIEFNPRVRMPTLKP